jgi:glycosyltransferase involved in cell wall biosynthesis
VLASVKDTWGLVVNEAMAAGLPCLVSSACGCAVDLIEHGVTGWCFDPSRSDELTALMHTAEQQTQHDRSAMVAAARECLQAYAPQTFAEGLQQAVEWASDHPHWSRRAALAAQLLSLRP